MTLIELRIVLVCESYDELSNVEKPLRLILLKNGADKRKSRTPIGDEMQKKDVTKIEHSSRGAGEWWQVFAQPCHTNVDDTTIPPFLIRIPTINIYPYSMTACTCADRLLKPELL